MFHYGPGHIISTDYMLAKLTLPSPVPKSDSELIPFLELHTSELIVWKMPVERVYFLNKESEILGAYKNVRLTSRKIPDIRLTINTVWGELVRS